VKIILNAAATDDALDHPIDLIPAIRREHTELRSRFLADRDGHRTRASGSTPTTGHTNEIDDDGTPMPARASDPTAQLVIDRDDPTDDIGKALATLVQQIQTMRRLGEAAISTAAEVRPPIKLQDPDKIRCENCLKAGIQEPREEGRELCRWCREEKTDRGRLPSRRLVQAHARGRITPRLRSEIAARDTEERKARRRKAKATR